MLQTAMMYRPDAGDMIRGGGGLRKVRWNLPGRGKRGSLRVIYYWDPPETIYMLLPYKKTDQDNLTPEQLKFLMSLWKVLMWACNRLGLGKLLLHNSQRI